MKEIQTANDFRGKAIGATFFTGFGAIWLVLALYVREVFSTINLTLLVTGTLALLLGCLWSYRQADRWPEEPEDPTTGRAFLRVNVAQWIAGFLAAFTLGRLHKDAYIPSAITAIVGVHFFPLAQLFRRTMHWFTGAALVAWASVTVLAVPVEQMQGVTSLGTGIVLWASAAVSLAMGFAAVRGESSRQGGRQRGLAA